MATKDDFTQDEWTRVVRAPMVAGMAISLADPGGPIELAKETMAAVRTATNPPSREQLLAEVALEIQAEMQQHRNPLKGFKPSTGGKSAGEQVLDELRAVLDIVSAKSTAEEATAFGTWLMAAAQAAAEAAKDGGFMGFKAERISEREQSMLDQVRGVVTQ